MSCRIQAFTALLLSSSLISEVSVLASIDAREVGAGDGGGMDGPLVVVVEVVVEEGVTVPEPASSSSSSSTMSCTAELPAAGCRPCVAIFFLS